MRNFFSTLWISLFAMTCAYTQPKIALTEFSRGVAQTVDIAHAGDERIFLVAQNGKIFIMSPEGIVSTTPFLDIQDKITSGGERGLLGLAFHPKFKENRYFFVNYTGRNGETRVTRYTVPVESPNQADKNSEKLIIQIDQPYSNHNAGDLAFGKDGYLYIPMGDGGSGGDPLNSGQSLSSLLGKILRLDVDKGDPYGIPSDNPFLNDARIPDEVWAFGLRNPWRFSFDRETYDMWIGDVGQGNWEEIDFQPANSKGGENYGWRCYEGNSTFNTGNCASKSTYTFPVFDYSHSNGNGCSVTGGFVYRGTQFPLLVGHYIFADFCSGRFWSTERKPTGVFETKFQLDFRPTDISTFGEDVNGELYAASLGSGRIYKISEICSPLIPKLSIEGDTLKADIGNQFQWFRNEQSVANATSKTYVPQASGIYQVQATYTNGCTVRSEPLAFVIKSTKPAYNHPSVSLYPNPMSGRATLDFPNPYQEAYTFRISDLQGRTVRVIEGIKNSSIEIDPEGLSSGLYVYELNGTRRYSGKLVVR